MKERDGQQQQSSSRAAVADDLNVPVGFRFHPTEQELVGYYLVKKLQGMDDLVNLVIREIDICKYEPWDLPDLSFIKSDDDEWFFFNRPDYKNDRKQTTKRTTNEGYWKITGKERVIKARDKRTVIGKKRTMTFYRGRVRNCQKTNWVIHEYYIPETHPNAKQRGFVLCRVKRKSDENTDGTTCDEGELSTYNASDLENQQHAADDMDIQEEYTHPQANLDFFKQARDLLLNEDNYHGLQSAFGDNEPDDIEEFLSSVIVDPDQDSCEQTTHTTLLKDSTQPESLRRVYHEDGGLSSDRDTEVVHGQVMRSQLLSEVPVGWSQSGRSRAVMPRNEIVRLASSSGNVAPKPQTDRLQLVTPMLERLNRLLKDAHPDGVAEIFQINSLQLVNDEDNSSSDDGATDIPQINSLQLVANEYYTNERTRRRTYPPSALTAPGKLRELQQQQIKAKEAAELRTAVDLPQKGELRQLKPHQSKAKEAADFPLKKSSTTKPNNDLNLAQSSGAEKGMKQTQNRTTGSNWKGSSFISWQTSPLTSPPSVYIFNTVLGTILFVFSARELVLYGQW